MKYFIYLSLLIGLTYCAETKKIDSIGRGDSYKSSDGKKADSKDSDEPVDKNVCKEGETIPAPCDIENGKGTIENTCEDGKYSDKGASCLVDTCNVEGGFAKIGNSCIETECDASIGPNSCSVGDGSGDFLRTCEESSWVDDFTQCHLTECTSPSFTLNVIGNTCDPKPMALTLSKVSGGDLATTFNAFESVFFKVENAVGTPELCIAAKTDEEKCIPASAEWAAFPAEGYIKSGYTYTSNPWFGRYTLSGGGDYRVNVRLAGVNGSAILLDASVTATPQSVGSVSATLNGNAATTLSSNAAIFVRGERLGDVSASAGIVTTTAQSAVCIELDNDASCASLTDFVDLVNGVAGWAYDAQFGGGVGRWINEFPADSIVPGNYKIHFLNKVINVRSPIVSVDVQ